MPRRRGHRRSTAGTGATGRWDKGGDRLHKELVRGVPEQPVDAPRHKLLVQDANARVQEAEVAPEAVVEGSVAGARRCGQ